MKHTPAPWTFQLDKGHLDIFLRNTKGKEICIVRPPYFHPGDFRERVEHESNAEALANAQLIAAAPDLLEALEALLLVATTPFESTNTNNTVVDKAKTAIQKATS